ncbi:LysR substrate-binding domain-containing protein [Acidisphaera sp. L21]|uniref:LysR substrate-binding domain-containing protein n=1 Tax=Acidisphaera sp. L21 TaxID=1641851 RepID=UPI00131D56CA|nr:LysR substrate-binding domain-containing protein [Acidisphaera sp. L21]
MDRHLPPLNSLRAFEVATRTRTFTEAARALHVSQGAISRHIGQLEAFLGQALFRRDGREPMLTEAGQDYARAIHGAFDTIEAATRQRLEHRTRHPVRIRLFPTVAVKWLMGRLARFHLTRPDIDVQVTTTFKLVDMATEDVDFTIQIPAENKPGLRYEALFPIELIPVAGPGQTPITDPAAMLDGSLLHSLKRPNDWHDWLAAAGVPSMHMRESLTFGNSSLAYQAAMDGLGIAMGHTVMVEDDLQSGRLVAMHPLVVRTDESYHLVSRTVDERPETVAFRKWILG